MRNPVSGAETHQEVVLPEGLVVKRASLVLLPGAMQVTPVAGGLMLMVAGAYQLTELKNSCLATCRSPMSFLITEWREGGKGAFIMGARHGIYCVGCCWSIMLVLFVAGVMNLLWVAGIAVFVLLEKTILRGRWMTRLAGLAAIVWGVWLLLPVVAG
ncbi:MAG: DUF2182 domain-containing protein [Gemmatimonadaceae bacterium]|nr:DUF2182 domain-containing protein [Gemmatimonadaceae bacterium]